MAWTEPKTDWEVHFNSDGIYTGQYFTSGSFNRIKNNLLYVRDLINPSVSFRGMGGDRTRNSYLHADDMNRLFENYNRLLVEIGEKPLRFPTFEDEGNTMSFVDLNTLEKGILDLYNRFS